MVHRAPTVALNNMPAASAVQYTPNFSGPADLAQFLESSLKSEKDKWTVTAFETTPPMSSYLVAFANGPFKYIEDSYVRFYGGDGEWRSRRIYHHMGRIVARVANRAFVGKELCE